MALHANRIVYGADVDDPNDYFAFEAMRGRLQPKSEQLEVLIRPGRHGESIRTSGVRGAPSQIVTVHYVTDWTAAANAIASYVTLKDGLPYKFIQHTTYYGYFKILEVVEVDAAACVNVIGSIEPNPQVVQVCQWTVISAIAPD